MAEMQAGDITVSNVEPEQEAQMEGSSVSIPEVKIPSYEQNSKESGDEQKKRASAEATQAATEKSRIDTQIKQIELAQKQREEQKKLTEAKAEAEYNKKPVHKYLGGFILPNETYGQRRQAQERYAKRLELENRVKSQENQLRQQELQARNQRSIAQQQRLAQLRQSVEAARGAFSSGEQVEQIFTTPSQYNQPYEAFSNFLAPQTEAYQYPEEYRNQPSQNDAFAFIGGSGASQQAPQPVASRPVIISRPRPVAKPSVAPVKIEIVEEEKPEKIHYEVKKKERVHTGHRGRPRKRGRPSKAAQAAKERYHEEHPEAKEAKREKAR